MELMEHGKLEPLIMTAEYRNEIILNYNDFAQMNGPSA